MDKLNKITLIKFSILVIYGLTLFTPIYSTEIWGVTLKTSISELGAGTFFIILFLILIVGVILTRFALEKYYKYVYLSTIGYMVLLFLMLLIFKDSLSSLRLTWYFHLVLIGILTLAHFKEELTLSIFDKIVAFIRNISQKIIAFLKEKMNKEEEIESETEGMEEEE